jgi:hypothetical protein
MRRRLASGYGPVLRPERMCTRFISEFIECAARTRRYCGITFRPPSHDAAKFAEDMGL